MGRLGVGVRGSETMVLPRDTLPNLHRGDYEQVLATTYATVLRVEANPGQATDDDWRVVALHAIATAYTGDPKRAVDIATAAYRHLLVAQGPHGESTMAAQRALAVAQLAAHDVHAALRNAEQVHALYVSTLGEHAAVTLDAAADLATCLHRSARCNDGVGLMQSTVDGYLAGHGHDPTSIGMIARLGAMLRDCGEFDRAHHLLGQARQLARTQLPPGDGLLTAITALSRAGADASHSCTADPYPEDPRPEQGWLAAMRDPEPTFDPPVPPTAGPTAAPAATPTPTPATAPADLHQPPGPDVDAPPHADDEPPHSDDEPPHSDEPRGPDVDEPPGRDVEEPGRPDDEHLGSAGPPSDQIVTVPVVGTAPVRPMTDPPTVLLPARPAPPAGFAPARPKGPARPVPAVDHRQGTMTTLSLLSRPAHGDRELRDSLRRAFGGPRQITVVNPKGGAGKTVATLMLGLTFGQARGGSVLAWDNNETQGTLGMRAQLGNDHRRTVRDLLRDLHRFTRSNAGVSELAHYLRGQEAAGFDVLASDEATTAGAMLTASAFRDVREVITRYYKLLIVDTGNNVRADNWRAAVDATDQLVVPVPARLDSAETAARMLDHLDLTDRRELVRRAIVVVTEAPQRVGTNQAGVDLRFIETHFRARCRAVLRVPYDRHLDSGAPIRYQAIAAGTRRSWLRAAAAVMTGL